MASVNPCPICRNGDVLENPQGMCPKCKGSEEKRLPPPGKETK